MQYHWLNKSNNNKLIVFFAGWSFDYKPFEYLLCRDYDVLFVYDYSKLKIFDAQIGNYQEKILISWSMGVYAAYTLCNELPQFDKKIAINGTVFPIDNFYGIPEKTFLLTLKHAEKGLQGKFYHNIYLTDEEFDRYMKNPVERPLNNRINELNSLYNKITIDKKTYVNYYDLALVSKYDRIIPTENQKNFWRNFSTKFRMLDSGHFPYYNYTAWNELIS